MTSCLNKALLLALTTLFVSQRQTQRRQAVVCQREAQVETALTGIDVNRHTCFFAVVSRDRAVSAVSLNLEKINKLFYEIKQIGVEIFIICLSLSLKKVPYSFFMIVFRYAVAEDVLLKPLFYPIMSCW